MDSRGIDRRAPGQLEQIAEVAAHKAVAQTFAMLGVDINQQADINDLREVLLHASKMQRLSQRVGLLSVLTIAAAVMSGALAFLWQGIIQAFHR